MHPLLQMIGGSPPKSPLDVLPVPTNRIEDLYTDMQAMEEDGSHRAQWDFWRSVHRHFPALHGKEFRLNVDHITRPVWEVTGDKKPPVVGRKNRHVIEVEAEHIYPILEMLDRVDSVLGRYRLWAFVEKEYPATRDRLPWHIHHDMGRGMWLVGRHADEEEDD